MDKETLHKLADGKPGSRGLPIKKFVEDPLEPPAEAYKRLNQHHLEETKILYDTLQVLAKEVLRKQPDEIYAITATYHYEGGNDKRFVGYANSREEATAFADNCTAHCLKMSQLTSTAFYADPTLDPGLIYSEIYRTNYSVFAIKPIEDIVP